METFINSVIDNYNLPILTAFLLGILTSISPCPLATNISAIGFLAKDIKNTKNVLFSSFFYIFGRMFSYTLVTALIYFGFSSFSVSNVFQGWGEKLLAPFLILIGLFLLGILKINLNLETKNWNNFKIWLSSKGYLGSFGLGMVFALAFCPYSGVLFFGIFIPLVLKSAEGIFLAPFFAIGTGIPVVLFAYLMALSLQKMSAFYKSTQKIEKWIRYSVAFLFIGVGIYYLKYTFNIENFDLFRSFEILAHWITFNFFEIAPNSQLGDAVNFFIYDTLKIFALMLIITHFMSWLRFYFPIEKLRDFLSSRKFYGLDYFLATIFGAITPFCTCSSIPLFIGFLEARIPLGVTFAFLITSPLVNEIAVSMLIGAFGWKITIFYVSAGIMIGVIGGFILGKLKLEKYVDDFVWNVKSKKINPVEKQEMKTKEIILAISKEALEITRQVAIYILLGVGIGATIHGFIPQNFFEKYLVGTEFWSVPLSVILAVPIYSNATGVIPIIQALIAKGVPIGTALAFMMAVVGLSLPEALILKKVLKWQLLVTFFGIVTLGIILIGYLFNFLF